MLCTGVTITARAVVWFHAPLPFFGSPYLLAVQGSVVLLEKVGSEYNIKHGNISELAELDWKVMMD